MKRSILINLTLALIGLVLAINFVPEAREKYLVVKYDLLNNNPTIETEAGIKDILSAYPKLAYGKLDANYKNWSKSSASKYRKILSASRYCVIKQEDFFKKLVGDFRIMHFVCKDSIYNRCLRDADLPYYWLIDEKLPLRVLALQEALEKAGYDKTAFSILSGHRHPKNNEEVKGAGSSKHLKGQAIDMRIYDINGDGHYSPNDKQIVLDILEREVIGNRGGIGRYPDTRVIHIDVRGKRARWDSY